jgi:hypothetical protein
MSLVTDTSTSLTDKVSMIVMEYLKQNPFLKTVKNLQWVNHLEASLVTPPVVHVSSKLNAEGVPGSGIWAVGVVIAYRYIVGKTKEQDAQQIWGAVNYQLFNFTSRDLAAKLAAIRPNDFLCFSVELSSNEEQTAQENERQRTIQLELNCAAT